MHLVILSHSMDDFPVRLFGEFDAAMEYAKSLDGELPERIGDIFNRDACSPCCVGVASFDDDGELVKFTVAKRLDEAPQPSA